MVGRVHRKESRVRPTHQPAQRGLRFSAFPEARRPLHLPSVIPTLLGNPPALRSWLRDLRLVRCAGELFFYPSRLGRPRGARASRQPSARQFQLVRLARRHSFDRQGHPQVPRRLLADHASRSRSPIAQDHSSPRLVAEGRRQAQQEHRQRGGSPGHHRRMGVRRLPLLRRS